MCPSPRRSISRRLGIPHPPIRVYMATYYVYVYRYPARVRDFFPLVVVVFFFFIIFFPLYGFFSYPIFYRGSSGLQFLFTYYFPLYKTRTHTHSSAHTSILNRYLHYIASLNDDDKCTCTHTTMVNVAKRETKKQLMLKINPIVPVAASDRRVEI